MRIPHLSAPKGKRVLVILRSGVRITDRFVERKSRYVVLEHAGEIRTEEIRFLTIIRTNPLKGGIGA